jgi:tRNA(Ile)-lysidine synthetase-like protein
VAKFTFLSKSTVKNDDLVKLCYNELAFPLWLRHREEGDVLAFDYGHKKLKKLFIDKKIPMKDRDQLWVLTDNDNTILWVQNHYVNMTLGDENSLYFKLNEVKTHA